MTAFTLHEEMLAPLVCVQFLCLHFADTTFILSVVPTKETGYVNRGDLPESTRNATSAQNIVKYLKDINRPVFLHS